MTDRELIQMALDALDEVEPSYYDTPSFKQPFFNVRKALRERLSREAALDKLVAEAERLGLYDTAPRNVKKREWVGLTDEDRYKAEACCWYMDEFDQTIYAEAIEDKLKEKNT